MSDFQKELLSAVVSKPKIAFSCDGSTSEDIISYGRKNVENFVRFYNYGDNGLSLLDGNKDNNWITTPNPEENAFTLLFNRHSVRLTKFQLHTGSKKSDKYAPDNFFLYGYNSRLKRWDVISDFQGKRLEPASLYSFDIREDNKKIFYRMLRFSSLSKVALAYIKLYGDAMEESDAPPEDVARSGGSEISYQKKPVFSCPKTEKFTEGILRTAMKIYGPQLKGFVAVTDKSDKSSKYYDIWNARNNSYSPEKSDKPIFICFYFPYHEVSISAYHIQPTKKGSIKRWCLLGCNSNQEEGLILDHHDNSPLEDKNSFYSFKLSSAEGKTFRILRFVGLEKDFSIQCLDFFGTAKPCAKVLTDKDIYGSFTFSHSIQEWRQAKK